MKMKKTELADFQKSLTAGMATITTKGVRATGSNVEVVKNEYVSITKYLRGALQGNWDKASEEQRIFKAVNSNIGTQGGFLIPVETTAEIIELLQNTSVVRQMPGVRIQPMARDTWTQRRTDTGATASWGNEGTAITESTSIRWGQISLQLKKLTSLYKMNREVIHDADVSSDDLVKMELAEAITLKEDVAFLEGLGGDQPLGLYSHPRIQWTRLDASMTFDDVLNAMQKAEEANSFINGWIGSPRTKFQLLKLKDAEGRQLLTLEGRVTDANRAQIGDLYGAIARWSNQVPNLLRSGATESYMLAGNWADFIIGDSTEGLRMEATDTGGSAFQNDQVWIKVIKRVDCALRHPESFLKLIDIQA